MAIHTHEIPAIHVHVHLHNGPANSALAEGDILTQHTYAEPTPPANPHQTDIFSAPASVPAPARVDRPDRPVAITPQTTHDQRREIGDYSVRNEHLVKVDEHLSAANSRESAANRVRLGLLGGYDEAALKKNARKARLEAASELTLACGNCALQCAIRDNFPKWSRIHQSADAPKTADQESRKSLRRRQLKKADAHCLPGKDKPAAKKAA